jgi:hypothetical protein
MAASYPGAVKTFSNRASGHTIEAAHINDLQDEVTAIEDGLLNGTAPLTSSNASVALLTARRLTLSSAAPATPAAQTVYTNSIIKAWAQVSSAGPLLDSFNMSSVTHPSSGLYQLQFATALQSSAFAVVATPRTSAVSISLAVVSQASTGIQVQVSSGTVPDDVPFSVMVVGL